MQKGNILACTMDLMGKLSSHSDPLDNTFMNWACEGLNEVPIDEIAKYPNVIYLDLSGNTIRNLSLDFCVRLSHIVHLDLSKNLIEKLPSNIGLMINVVHLDLYNNLIQALPVTMSDMENLSWLDMKENPVNRSLKEVVGDFWNVDDCRIAAKNVVAFMAQVKLLIKNVKDFEYQNVHSFTLRSNPFSTLVIRQDVQKSKEVSNTDITSGPAAREFSDYVEKPTDVVNETKALDAFDIPNLSLKDVSRFSLRWTLNLMVLSTAFLLFFAMYCTPTQMANLLSNIPMGLHLDRYFLQAHRCVHGILKSYGYNMFVNGEDSTPDPESQKGWGDWIW